MSFLNVTRLIGAIGATALLLFPTPAAAQKAPAATAALPDGYVGAETCKGCHQDQFERFSATTMGKLFLKHPRTAKEALACETCHGPGKTHVEAGGGKGAQAKLITFSKADPTPV